MASDRLCEVCGTPNESRLTFCRNCGNRLASRVIPPTPATGMKKAQVPARGAPEVDEGWEQPAAAPTARHSRPSAPPLFLTKSKPPVPVGSGQASGASETQPPANGEELICGSCGATSPKGYRFCLSCGGALGKRSEPRRSERARAPEASGPRSAPGRARVAEGTAMERGTPADARSKGEGLACGKCGGRCAADEAFCKYCGAPLPRAPKPSARETEAPRVLEPRAVEPRAVEPRAVEPRAVAPRPLEPAVRSDEEVPARRQRETDRSRPRAEAPPEATGRLVVIVEDGSEGRTIDLVGQQLDVGRRDGDIILSEDRYLSPRHARLYRQDGRWFLRDLESLNGVFRRLRKPEVLRDQDLVLLGLEVLQFEVVEHAERGLGHAIQHGTLVFGSPAAMRRARLCQRTVEGVVRDVYHLVADETTVGRELGDIVFTSDPFMSRRHAVIRWQPQSGEFMLADLNSSNGTYLAIREDVRLENGDFIRLGQHLFRVDLPPAGAH